MVIRQKMITNFLIINCIGKDDKLGLGINKDFFIHNFKNGVSNNESLVFEIQEFLNCHKIKLDKRFTVIVNQGPGSFSCIRTSIAVAKGLEISRKTRLFGFRNTDLMSFDQENIEKLINQNLIEKKLIKPIYLS